MLSEFLSSTKHWHFDFIRQLEVAHYDCSHWADVTLMQSIALCKGVQAEADNVKGESSVETLSLAPAKSGSRLSVKRGLFFCLFTPLILCLEHWGLTADRRHNNKAHLCHTNSNFCWLEAGCCCKWVNTHIGGCIKLSDISPNILCFNLDTSCLSPLPNKWVS